MTTKKPIKDITPGAETATEAVTPEYIPAPNDLCVTANTLTFNWREDEITAWVDKAATWATGIVVTESEIPGIKTEMANLNGIIKKLTADAIAAEKSVSGPIREFRAKVKALCDKVDTARETIATRVRAIEVKARDERRVAVQFAIEAITAENGFPGLHVPIEDSWLNATQKPKQTAADIQAFILRHAQAEKATAAAEQAKQDRASSIEDACATQASAFGFSIPASTFLRLQSLETPLADARAEILRTYEANAEAMQRVQNTAKAPAPAAPLDAFGRTPLAPQAAPAPQAPLGFRKGMTIHLEYEAHREAEVLAALEHLQGLCTDYVRHAKPLASSYGQPTAQAQRPVQRPY